jgi:hypothetical protein
MDQLEDADWQADIVRSIDPEFDARAYAERLPFSESSMRDSFVTDLQRTGL